jgi:hypothetical protein
MNKTLTLKKMCSGLKEMWGMNGKQGPWDSFYDNVGPRIIFLKKLPLTCALQPSYVGYAVATDTGTYFNKLRNIPTQNFTKSVMWEMSCSMRTDGQTNMTKPIFAFATTRMCLKMVTGTKGQTRKRTKINYRQHNQGSGNGATPVTHFTN